MSFNQVNTNNNHQPFCFAKTPEHWNVDPLHMRISPIFPNARSRKRFFDTSPSARRVFEGFDRGCSPNFRKQEHQTHGTRCARTLTNKRVVTGTECWGSGKSGQSGKKLPVVMETTVFGTAIIRQVQSSTFSVNN